MRFVYGYLPELLRLPWALRRLLVIAVDLALCSVAVLLAFWLRHGEWDPVSWPTLAFLGIANSAWLAVAVLGGTYRSVIRFSSRYTIYRLLRVFVALALAEAILLLSLGIPGVPRTLSVLHPLVFFLGAAATRIGIAQLIFVSIHARSRASNERRVLIYGAGAAGQKLANSMRSEPGLRLIGFVDANEALKGRIIEGKEIWHHSRLEEILANHDITDVFIAMPSARRAAKRAIVDRLNQSAVQVRVRALPSISEIAFGHVAVTDLREVQVEELLGRDEVAPQPELLAHDIYNKRVLVTGAGGSIGSELSRQILRQGPSVLILADQSEHALYTIDAELREFCDREGLKTLIMADLADVADERDCKALFSTFTPDTVFHAAAYKHVPMVEANRISGIRNNVLGTLNAALAAEASGVTKFVLVSTDKAVRPTNIMGASKRVCELIIQARAGAQTCTTFTAVRFGNVLGSSGSVVPRFKEQIAKGGPVTVTHRDVTRYFMTIPEAALLVIQAGAMAQGGEVFLLDMGQPIKIVDLARTMIELSGLTPRDEHNPDGDIDIIETGLRPGEKLYEELLIDADSIATEHPRIVKAREQMLQWPELAAVLDRLSATLISVDPEAATTIVRDLVPGYSGKSDGVARARA